MFTLKKTMMAAAAAVGIVGSSMNASAGLASDDQDFNLMQRFGGNATVSGSPPIESVIEIGFTEATRAYTNTDASGVVRTVGFVTLGSAKYQENLSAPPPGPVEIPGPLGGPNSVPSGSGNSLDPATPVILVFAIEGTAVAGGGGSAIGTFTRGSAVVVEGAPFQLIAGQDPTSWYFDPATTTGNVLGQYILGEADAYIPNPPQGDDSPTVPLFSMNKSGSTAANPFEFDGDFRFDFIDPDDASDVQRLTDEGLSLLVTNPDYINSQGGQTFQEEPDPAGIQSPTDDTIGVVASINEQVIDPNGAGASTIGAAQAARLNDYANSLLGNDFADFFAVNADNYAPGIDPGDNEFNLSGSADPFIVATVPEPTTAILGLMGLAGLAARRRRQA